MKELRQLLLSLLRPRHYIVSLQWLCALGALQKSESRWIFPDFHEKLDLEPKYLHYFKWVWTDSTSTCHLCLNFWSSCNPCLERRFWKLDHVLCTNCTTASRKVWTQSKISMWSNLWLICILFLIFQCASWGLQYSQWSDECYRLVYVILALAKSQTSLRILDLWENLKRYFLEYLPSQKEFKRTIQPTERYKRITSILRNPSSQAYLAFLTYICQHFETFLLKFQRREPMIHVLHTALTSLLLELM